jgi:hypothetical protein
MELGIIIASAILSTIAVIFSMVSVIMLIAREKATHTVQMVPVDEEIERANEEYLKKWATSEEAINKQNKLHQEDIERDMPEFALDDEDKEIFSI